MSDWTHSSHGDMTWAHATSRTAPRLRTSAPVRMRLRHRGHEVATLGQTVDLSLTGMLVRGSNHYPVGTGIDFALELPGLGDESLHGRATIARRAGAVREGVHGYGVAFIDFESGDDDRLRSYLESRLQRDPQ